MNKIFTRDIVWKLFSLVAAVVLWLFVMNIIDPELPHSASTYITIVGKEQLLANNLVITNEAEIENTRVTIKVRGKRSALDILGNGQFQATIDMSINWGGIREGEPFSVPVNIQLPQTREGLEMTGQDKRLVNVVLEKVVTAQKTIEVVTVGEAAQGYEIYPRYTISQNVIQVKGPQSRVERVDSVKIFVDIENANKDLVLTAEPRLYDRDGNELQGVEKNLQEVQIQIPIQKVKQVPLQTVPAIQGMPAEGYTLTNVEVSPKTIEIIGEETVVNAVQQIQLPTINIQNLSGTKEFAQDLRELLPENVSLRPGTPTKVIITVETKKEAVREFLIPAESLNIRGNLSPGIRFQFVSENVTLLIKGIEEAVNKVLASRINGSINLAGYGIGQHEIPVTFDLPSGVSRIGDPPTVTIVLTREEEEEVQGVFEEQPEQSEEN